MFTFVQPEVKAKGRAFVLIQVLYRAKGKELLMLSKKRAVRIRVISFPTTIIAKIIITGVSRIFLKGTNSFLFMRKVKYPK